MNRRAFITSMAVSVVAAAAGHIPEPVPTWELSNQYFTMVQPFIQKGKRLWLNKEYTEAKFRGWVFRAEDGKDYFQIRKDDDPPKAHVIFRDMWPMKFKLCES